MKRNSHLLSALVSCAMISALVACSSAEKHPVSSDSRQPYIDQIKYALKQQDQAQDSAQGRTLENPDPYIQAERAKLKEGTELISNESYIEKIKRSQSEQSQAKVTDVSYTSQAKAKLEPVEQKSVIEAVKAGESSLEMKRPGIIRHFASVRVSAYSGQSIMTPNIARPFSDVYSTGWIPDFNLTYGFIPFRHEWIGNIGFSLSAGFMMYTGKGALQFPLKNPVSGLPFGSESKTTFRFMAAPITPSLNVQLNTLWLFRPYVNVGPTFFPYYEMRSDSVKGHRGYSFGVTAGGGVNILMDWMSKSTTWDLYDTYSVKHYYLTLDFTQRTPLAGDVQFSGSLFSAGFTYEF